MNDLITAIIRLDAWLDRNGWAGYDPYDIKGTRLFSYLLKPADMPAGKFLKRLISIPLLNTEAYFPRIARDMLGVTPTVNAKAMGLFARGYLQLFRTTSEDRYRLKALECLDWLMHSTSSGYAGVCWGYPFNWQSKIFIPVNTPSSVVSSVVGDAFWTAWIVLGERRYLDVCISICQFFVDNLNQSIISDSILCFSYTPLDDFHVHNANLLVAEFLIRVGMAIDRDDWIDLGLSASCYALHEQRSDGSLYYWGRVQNHYNKNHNDHYHAGFEIRALYAIWNSTGREEYRQAFDRYYAYYGNNLLLKDEGLVLPKMTSRSLYPINIHSCAEALLLNATLAPDEPRARRVLPALISWIIKNMQTPQGSFIYMRRRVLGREWVVSMPYIRWGQAWMLLALAQCLDLESRDAV